MFLNVIVKNVTAELGISIAKKCSASYENKTFAQKQNFTIE